MLFKTLSAAVFGIDAYLVEVEVDVGSARMNDFNVVGLPDNAVKESRERIKSALRNCGIEFPYGQGVTINLAPADANRREQSPVRSLLFRKEIMRQRANGPAPHSKALHHLERRRKTSRKRHHPPRPFRSRSRPHPQSRSHHRRPRRLRLH